MVLTKSELIALLQKEVRLLLHLTTKIDQDMLDYRPTPKQRSTIELLRYLTTSGPALISYAKGQPMDAAAIAEATETANKRNFDETVAALSALSDSYPQLLADFSDEDPEEPHQRNYRRSRRANVEQAVDDTDEQPGPEREEIHLHRQFLCCACGRWSDPKHADGEMPEGSPSGR